MTTTPPTAPHTEPRAKHPLNPVGVRRRIQAMAARGWPLHIQATYAGIEPCEYSKLLNPLKRIDRETAKRVVYAYDHLSIVDAPASRAASLLKWKAAARRWFPPVSWKCIDDIREIPAPVPTTVGVHRRIQAWACMGWALHQQAGFAGIHPREYAKLPKETHIDPQTAVKIGRAFHRTGTSTYAPATRGASLMKLQARQNGWFPPCAWDDHNDNGGHIDDPRALPSVAPRVGLTRRQQLPADVELLIQHWAAGHIDALPVPVVKSLSKPGRAAVARRLMAADYTTAKAGQALRCSSSVISHITEPDPARNARNNKKKKD